MAHGFGTFEEVPPTDADIAGRIAAVLALGLPYLVIEEAGQVLGFSYASSFRPRAAYRYTAEDSVYVAPGQQGRGIGRALVAEVMARCQALGLRQLVAVIGDSGNEASLRLHARLGFRTIGQALRVGVKFGRWVDIVHLQRALGDETARPPAEDPVGYAPVADQTGP